MKNIPSPRSTIAVAATGALAEILADTVPDTFNAPEESRSIPCPGITCDAATPASLPSAAYSVTDTVLADAPGFKSRSSVLFDWSSRITGTTCVDSGCAVSVPSRLFVKSPEKYKPVNPDVGLQT